VVLLKIASAKKYVLPYPSFTQNSPELLLLNFLLYHHSHFLAAPFDLTTFFTLAILNRAAPFSQFGCFE